MKTTVLLFGVGNVLRGDDGAGPAVVEMLRRESLGWLRAVDCGQNPENWLSLIGREHPEEVLFVDAATMGLDAGSIRRISPEAPTIRDPGLIDLPWRLLLASYVTTKITFIGIEPRQCSLGAPLSAEVTLAVTETARSIAGRGWPEIPLLPLTR
ncbi:MAG: hydrogenase maturation protease [Synergistales bacterium]|nr:hydrogenase maturation protease [Synergistales bacterium]